jgi:hypothetical protein
MSTTHPSNPPATAESFTVENTAIAEVAHWIDSTPQDPPGTNGIYKRIKIGDKYLVIWVRPIGQPTK